MQLLVLSLSAIQGLLLGFAFATVYSHSRQDSTTLFALRPALVGAESTSWELGVLTCIAYPYVLHNLFAPSLRPRLARHPRRNTIISFMALGVFLLITAARLDDALKRSDVYSQVGYLTTLVALTTLTEITSNVWMQGTLSHGYQNLGINLGGLLSQCLLLMMHPQSSITQFVRGSWHVSYVLQAIAMATLFLVGWVALIPSHNGMLLDSRTSSMGSSSMSMQSSLSQKRSFSWMLLTESLPFITIEFLGPLKLLQKGMPVEWLVGIRLSWCIPAILSGVWVHSIHASRRMKLWIYAYYTRLLLGLGLTYTVMLFTSNASDQLHILMAYSVLEVLFTFCGNVMLISQSLMIEGLSLSEAMQGKLHGLRFLGSWMPRLVIYLLSDLASQQICFRQNQQFVDVPCSWNGPFNAVNNLCTDSGGECRVVQDGFHTVSYTLLGLGIPMGILYAQSLHHVEHEQSLRTSS